MIQAGDIIGIRGKGFLSRGILAATSFDGHDGVISHVGIFLTGDPQPIVIEALSRVRTNALATSIADAEKAYVIKDMTLADAQREAIKAKALTFSARSYGYYEIGLQLADALFHTTWPTDRLSFDLRSHPICSFVAAVCYGEVGLNFGKAMQSITPADIYRYASNNKAFTIEEIQ